MNFAGVSQGVLDAMTAQRAQAAQQQEMQLRQMEIDRNRQAAMAPLYVPQQPVPQPPMPGQTSQPSPPPQMQMPQGGPPPMPPNIPQLAPLAGSMPMRGVQPTPAPPPQAKPPIPPYQTLQGLQQRSQQIPMGQPPSGPPSQPPSGPPSQPPQDQGAPQPPGGGGMMDLLQAASRMPVGQQSAFVEKNLPYVKELEAERQRQWEVVQAANRAALEARNLVVREAHEKEHERHDRAMEPIAQQRADASDPSKGAPLDKETVDFYAKLVLSGDNSWMVGLARGKVGQKLIAAVKDRVPKLAAEQGMTPQDVSANKAIRESSSSALRDRTKYVAAGTQFVNNFNKQSDLVEKYLKPGIGGSIPVFNRWIQAGRKQVAGDADVSALDTAIRGLAREHQRIVTGVTSNAQLHASAQETADQLLNISQSEAQIRANLKEMREEATNALDSGKEEVGLLQTQIKAIGTAPKQAAPSDKDAEAVVWAKANPNDPRAAKIMEHNRGL